MIELHEEVYMDGATSCTINTAVMKLLGYAQGPIYRRLTRYSPEHDGVPEDEMEDAPPTLLPSIEDELNRLHHITLIAAENAVNKKEPDEEIQKKVDKIKELRETMKQAFKYKIAIMEEIEKASDSMLKIDANKTEETGEIYITLSSFERWRAVSLKNDRNEEQTTPVADEKNSEEEEERGEKEEKISGAHKSTLITLYIAFEMLRERNLASEIPLPSRKCIAERIAQKAINLILENGNGAVLGQGIDSIQDRLALGEKYFGTRKRRIRK